MHPILFRIPLPTSVPLRLWWLLAAVAVVLFAFAGFAFRRGERKGSLVFFFLAVASGVAAGKFQDITFTSERLPIYSYGVMLGASLVVGWMLTLRLAERDGLPPEEMANCYIVTAIAAIVGARLLYVVTNLDEFQSFGDLFALNKGGLVAYGGFLGGFLGSWAYLRPNRIRVMPWADVAVPSLAAGLFITRIGCYLFGCDYGTRLSATAPAFLQKLGTFPHWDPGTQAGGDGAPAFVHQLKVAGNGTPAAAELLKLGHSFPVHPTQIYESIAGLALLALVLLQRKHQAFRGQIFLLFTFAYGYVRFLIEMFRDDPERNAYGSFSEHLFIPFALLVMGIAFSFGIALGIRNVQARLVARVAAVLVPVVVYFMLRPPSFGATTLVHPSTSQWIGLFTAVAASVFYFLAWQAAQRSPEAAMGPASLGDFEPPAKEEEEDEKETGVREDGHDEAQAASVDVDKEAEPTVKAS